MSSRHSERRTPAHGPTASPRPDAVELTTFMCQDDGVVPNNPLLPVVLLAGATEPGAPPPHVMALFEANGWRRTWHYTVFDYQHYHPNAHEALAVVAGWADIQLGGPSGDIHRVVEGDVMMLPAGTGHCRIDARDDFAVVGGYPPGQEDREIVRAIAQNRRDASERIARVGLPETDPVFGADGPLVKAWGRAR